MSLAMRRIVFVCAFVFFGCAAAPVMAGRYQAARHHWAAVDFCGGSVDDDCYRYAQHVIHHKENAIAYLEADPDVDEGFKERVILHGRAKIHWLRSAVGIRHIVWPGPCCYSHRPVFIR
jgi:hypothetical protein